LVFFAKEGLLLPVPFSIEELVAKDETEGETRPLSPPLAGDPLTQEEGFEDA
jgi:hypothetical protein